MAQYAAETKVTPDRTRAEIERTLMRYGATKFGYVAEANRAAILFEMQGRRIRMLLAFPELEAFRLTANYRARSESAMREAREQAIRQRWRALLLLVKAKLEAIESGITTFEAEMLAGVVLPDGSTVGEWIAPQLDAVYDRGEMPPLLPGVSAPATLALPEAQDRAGERG